MTIRWTLKTFQELTPDELYAALRLRSEVFVVEQQCVFLDMDNKDQPCHHLLGWQGNHLAACTRIVPPGLSYDDYPSIGRVVTSPAARGQGMGRILMEESIRVTEALYGKRAIRIGAQLYLKKFYESLGFEQSSEVYDEDGIDHIEMTRP
ncbi:GNAT family N-acetyltransferase [Terrimonas ferruginea]|uniref:GNAT family N-acetyltransferase n=1 Tax=Terrimonas ferruginea TaxID=249 RepID=UPI0003F59689|nr:GNAT family N-acetyltransferase [Terrimonas ferruginea]